MWWAEPLADAGAAAAVVGLDAAERERCASLRRPADRARFVTGRIVARRALAAELGVAAAEVSLLTRCPTCGGPHGKPRPAGVADGLELSIAHAADRVVVAVCRGAAVGVDVEPVRGCGELAGAHAGVLAGEERAAVAALTPALRDAAFIRMWTRKEAVLKATGDGLTVALDGLRVTAPGDPPAVLAWPPGVPPGAARMLDLDLGPGYRACVAILTDGEVVWSDLTRAAAEPAAAARRRSR